MSHLRCPLCGKNAPLQNWSPETYDMDIMVASFMGKGRAMGFEKTEEYSVLGDSEITPRIVERIINLLNLCLQEGIITKDYLIEKLKLEKKVPGQVRVVPSKLYGKSEVAILFLRIELDKIRKESTRNYGMYYDARRQLEELQKEIKREREAESVLLWFLENCDATMIPDLEFGYRVIINMIDPDIVHELRRMQSGTGEDVKKLVKKRITCKYYVVEFILNEFFFKKRLTISERMLNISF